MKRLKKVKIIYSILAVCLIGFGILLLMRPIVAQEFLFCVGGIILIVFGIVKIVGYFSKDILQLAFQFDFALGIISCLLGVLILGRPKALLGLLPAGIGLFVLADALLKIQTAMDARKIGVAKWWIILVIALCVAASGAALFFLNDHEIQMNENAKLIGLNLIIDGILNLFVVQSTVNTIRRKR